VSTTSAKLNVFSVEVRQSANTTGKNIIAKNAKAREFASMVESNLNADYVEAPRFVSTTSGRFIARVVGEVVCAQCHIARQKKIQSTNRIVSGASCLQTPILR
jgi:hypothetical protein